MLLALIAAATADVPRPELIAAIAAYDRAQVEGNAAALNRLIADDYLLINSRGQVEDKKQFIADSTAADFKLEPFVIEHPIIRVWRNGAIAGGIAHLRGVSGNQHFDANLRFTDVWAYRMGHWRVIYTHASRAD